MHIDSQAVTKPVAPRVVVPEQLERLDVFWIALGEPFQKGDLNVEIPFLLGRKWLSFR